MLIFVFQVAINCFIVSHGRVKCFVLLLIVALTRPDAKVAPLICDTVSSVAVSLMPQHLFISVSMWGHLNANPSTWDGGQRLTVQPGGHWEDTQL